MHLYDVLHDERDFKIIVNKRDFFHEPLFPILELVKYCQQWQKETGVDFIYNTIESDENPLLHFRRIENGWMITSVWQKFICDEIFSDDEVKSFVSSLIQQVLIT